MVSQKDSLQSLIQWDIILEIRYCTHLKEVIRMPRTLKGNIRKVSTGDGRVSPINEVKRTVKGEKRKGKY